MGFNSGFKELMRCHVIYRDEIRAASNQGGSCVTVVQKQFRSVQQDACASEIWHKNYNDVCGWRHVAQDCQTDM